jgi:hypothetical protein
MFDLRYHVISLAAVFLALILGILVGVAISDPDLANRTELRLQRDEIDRLNERLEAAEDQSQQRDAAEQFVDSAYGAVMKDRLSGERVALVFVGPVDRGVWDAVDRALRDAGAPVAPMRALTVPVPGDAVAAALDGKPALAGYRGDEHVADLGRDLGREFVDGDERPLWDALETTLVEQRRLPAGEADAVVVVRTATPQGAETGRFLRGFYDGLRAGATVVGVETTRARPTAVPAFRRAGFASVKGVDTALGRVALAVVLGGGPTGQYGVQEDGKVVLPPISPVEPRPEAGGG